jgi:hypothetical protein
MSGARVRPPDLAPVLRSAFGGVVAVALVSGGILGLQWLVPAERDSPAVVGAPDGTGPTAPEPTTAAPAPTTAAPTATATAAPRPALTVLNNSRVTGLAKKAAEDFAARGWRIAVVGNLTTRHTVTTVYYGPGQQDAAAELQRQFPAVADVRPRYDGLPGAGGLTVVLTRDYPHLPCSPSPVPPRGRPASPR